MEEGGGAIDPLHHFELHNIMELHLFGIDLSITQAVLWMWISAALVFFGVTFVAMTLKRYPKGIQNLIEAVVDFLRKELVLKVIGEEGKPWFPYIATLFFFIFTCNILGLIPGSFTPTGNINVTIALASLGFIMIQGAGIRKYGLFGYFKAFIPSGIPSWVLPIMLPIEFIGLFAKPFSLAVRLFANMMAGHMVILVFLSMIILFKSVLITPVPLIGVVIMSAFEIFVSLIQAYIFTVLTASYMSDALHMEH
ncbi:MAG: F0F1 ATP synthase subunit A [Nitrospiria bacterium]